MCALSLGPGSCKIATMYDWWITDVRHKPSMIIICLWAGIERCSHWLEVIYGGMMNRQFDALIAEWNWSISTIRAIFKYLVEPASSSVNTTLAEDTTRRSAQLWYLMYAAAIFRQQQTLIFLESVLIRMEMCYDLWNTPLRHPADVTHLSNIFPWPQRASQERK